MNNKSVLTIVVVILIGLVSYLILTKPDDRNGFQKAGDAISELPNGPEKAARQLEDRTPGEKIKDNIKDATDGK